MDLPAQTYRHDVKEWQKGDYREPVRTPSTGGANAGCTPWA